MAPEVGLEPTTLRLTAECSAIELLRNTSWLDCVRTSAIAYSVIAKEEANDKVAMFLDVERR